MTKKRDSTFVCSNRHHLKFQMRSSSGWLTSFSDLNRITWPTIENSFHKLYTHLDFSYGLFWSCQEKQNISRLCRTVFDIIQFWCQVLANELHEDPRAIQLFQVPWYLLCAVARWSGIALSIERKLYCSTRHCDQAPAVNRQKIYHRDDSTALLQFSWLYFSSR